MVAGDSPGVVFHAHLAHHEAAGAFPDESDFGFATGAGVDLLPGRHLVGPGSFSDLGATYFRHGF